MIKMDIEEQQKKVFWGVGPKVSLENIGTERTIVKSARIGLEVQKKVYGLVLTVYSGIDHGFRDSTGQYTLVLKEDEISEFLKQTGFRSVENIAGKSVVAHYTTKNKDDLHKEDGRDLSARTIYAVSRDYEPGRVDLCLD